MVDAGTTGQTDIYDYDGWVVTSYDGCPTGSNCSRCGYNCRAYVTETASGGSLEPVNIIINIPVKNYIEKILRLAKWYIIFVFNCFRIRAPCSRRF